MFWEKIKTGSFVLALVLLSGCSDSRVSVFVKHHFLSDYSKIWLTFEKIEAVSSDGKRYPVFDNADGMVVNLSDSRAMLELIASHYLPAGEYREFIVHLKSDVRLFDHNNHLVDARLNRERSTEVMSFATDLQVENGVPASLTLDFSIDRFHFFPQDEVVVLDLLGAVASRTETLLSSAVARLEGTLIRLDDDGEFALLLHEGRGNTLVSVAAVEQTLIVDHATGVPLLAMNDIPVGSLIEVNGQFDHELLRLNADAVFLFSGEDTASATSGIAYVEYSVQCCLV